MYFGLSSDDHTSPAGLSYNLRAGDSPLGEERFVAMADPVTGRRLVHRNGNFGNQGFRVLKNLLAPSAAHRGPLYMAIQAIDGAFAGGPWTPVQRVDVGGFPRLVSGVPGDQGGRVRVEFRAGLYDTTATTANPVTQYAVWRRVPAGALAETIAREGVALAPAGGEAARSPGAMPAAGDDIDIPFLIWQGRRFADPAASQNAAFPAGTCAPAASTWDGRGESHARLGAGLYFVRLQAAGQSAARRVIRID